MSVSFDFSQRVLLDSNVLINSALVPRSLARLVIKFLLRSGTPTYAPAQAVLSADTKKALTKSRIKHALPFDPLAAIETHITELRLLTAPPTAGAYLSAINRRDEPIARSAKQIGACLVTDDVELIHQCRKIGISAVQPWEVARSYEGSGSLLLPRRDFRILPLPRDRGSIFIRATPGAWASAGSHAEFTLLELKNSQAALNVSYSQTHGAWCFAVEGLGIVRLPMALQEIHHTIYANYRASGGRVALGLSAASITGSVASAAPVTFSAPLPQLDPISRGGIGHTEDHKNYWSGYIKDIVVAGGLVATFATMAKTVDLCPNPYDGNKLDEELKTHRSLVLSG